MAMFYPQATTLAMGPTAVYPGSQYYCREDNIPALPEDDLAAHAAAWSLREVKLTVPAGAGKSADGGVEECRRGSIHPP